MNADIKYIIAMSCIIPAAVGLYKYNKIDKRFHPLIYMMILDVIFETITYLSIKIEGLARAQLYVVNIYMLANFSLFLFFVLKNRYISITIFRLLILTAFVVAGVNAFYSGTLLTAFYYLLCYVSLVMLIISIDILSKQIFELKTRLVNNFWFWFGSASILYNAFTLMIFALYIFTMFNTPNGKAIGSIQHAANAIHYLLIAFALLKIPVKQLPYLDNLTGIKK